MRRKSVTLFGVTLLTALVGTRPGMPAFAERSQLPQSVVAPIFTEIFDVPSQGPATKTVHLEIILSSKAAAYKYAAFPISYDGTTDQVRILQAETISPEGRRTAAAPDMILTRNPPGASSTNATNNYTSFTDSKEKVVLFPQVHVGDRLSLTYEIKSDQLFPGQFSDTILTSDASSVTGDDIDVKEIIVTIRLPVNSVLRSEASHLAVSERTEGSQRVWTWSANQIDPASPNPTLSVSTFASYEDLSRTLGAVMLPKSDVTPAVRALADRLTAHLSTPAAQAAALYDWVSDNIRYIDVAFGTGNIIPADPDLTLKRGFGDCKGHAALLRALLQAKAIESEYFLLKIAGPSEFPPLPLLSNLDHIINYVPSLSTYMDTTDGETPFGFIPAFEYGTPALLVLTPGMAGPAVIHLPLLPPGKASIAVDTTAVVAADGTTSGTTVTSATGPYAGLLRLFVKDWSSEAQARRSAKSALDQLGLSGEGNYALTPLEAPTNSYTVEGNFTLEPVTGFLKGHTPAPLPRLLVFPPLGDPFLSIGLTTNGGTPNWCQPGIATETTKLTLPKGRHLRSMPKQVTLRNPIFDYAAQWRWKAPLLTVERRFTTHGTATGFCPVQWPQTTQQQLDKVQTEYDSKIALAP